MSVATLADGAGPSTERASDTAWTDACLVARLIATAPRQLGGLVLRAQAGPVRDGWLEYLRCCVGHEVPIRKVPLHIADERLIGGLDLAATLSSGKPLQRRGVLAEADGGLVVVPMAERMDLSTASHLASVLDRHEVVVERDGFSTAYDARIAVIALDEGIDQEEALPTVLTDRLAFRCDLSTVGVRDIAGVLFDTQPSDNSAGALSAIQLTQESVAWLTELAQVFGVSSVRALQFAAKAAMAHAALEQRTEIEQSDLVAAARLVIAPRATQMPADNAEPPPETEEDPPSPNEDEEQPIPDGPIDDMDVQAISAAIPQNLLDSLVKGAGRARNARTAGRKGREVRGLAGGKPIGSRRGTLGGKNQIHVVDTLRAAAPWQKLRSPDSQSAETAKRVSVRKDDIRIRKFKRRSESVTLFVVDASGSQAIHRLAEAKGAVELMLADCYSRRDQVALITFRGTAAELVLPPTRSLVRTKRALSGVPGGGGTPLAAGIDAATDAAIAVTGKGRTAQIVLLTDGSANVARDGSPGRKMAWDDSLAAAERLLVNGVPALVIDTSPRGNPNARTLASTMGAAFIQLPQADAKTVRASVDAALGRT